MTTRTVNYFSAIASKAKTTKTKAHVLDLTSKWWATAKLLKLLSQGNWYRKADSGCAVSLRAFFGHQWLWVGTFAGLGFAFEHFDVLMAVEVHWFGFGRLGCLCRLWGDGGGRRQALASGTGSEDMYVLDFAAPQLRGVGTGGTYLQVNFLNPSRKRKREKKVSKCVLVVFHCSHFG